MMGGTNCRVQGRYGSFIDVHFSRIENALEFDLTQRDSESEVTVGTCSDTESCVDVPNNRLRLVWDPSVPDPSPQWHPEARAVEGFFTHQLPGSGRFQPVLSAQSSQNATLVSRQCSSDLDRFGECRFDPSIGLVDRGSWPDCRTNCFVRGCQRGMQ